MIVCKVCGFDNEAGAAFCGSCGSFLEWTGESTETDATRAAAAATPATPPVPVVPRPLPHPVDPPTVVTQAPANPTDVICPSCGMANERERVFCKRCATELAPAPLEPVGPVASTGSGIHIPPGPAIIVGAVAVVLIGGAIVLGGVLGKSTPSPAASAGASAAVVSPRPSASVAASPSAASPSAPESVAPSLPPLTGLIAFGSGDAGSIDLYVAAPDGSDLRRIVKDKGNDTQPAWAPNGTRIAYANATGIMIVDADGKNGLQFTHHDDVQPAWSPDGSMMAFASKRDGDYEIYLRHIGKTDLIPLTKNAVSDTNPSWSGPDDLIAFVSDRDGNKDIWTMKPNGSALVQLTKDPAVDDQPAWSDDGKTIAFTSDRDQSTSFVYLMDADGSNVRRLTTGSDPEFDPTWSADGTYIAFRRGDASGTIAVVSVADGQDIDTFANGSEVARNPAWQ